MTSLNKPLHKNTKTHKLLADTIENLINYPIKVMIFIKNDPFITLFCSQNEIKICKVDFLE